MDSETMVTVHEFFERAAAGTLTAIRCGQCQELAIPPKEFCPACGGRAWTRETLAGDGTIASFTVIRVPPAPHAGQAPYAIAQVRMKEGPSLTGRVVDVPVEAVAVGMPVRYRALTRKRLLELG